MSIKILTKNSIDNTNIDGARQNHFSAGMRSGIVRGAFNEGRFFATASNIIALDTCELRISGHQVIIDSLEAITLSDRPSTPTKYSMIAEIQVSDMSVPSFRLFIQPASVDLRQENLFKTNNGSGTYQLRIGNFTLGTTGLITDVIRTADIITGGGDGGLADIKFNATATQLSSSSQPEVNADYNEETKEWDLNFGIPAGSGSRVTIGGVEQPTWSADFSESERQKSKNLLVYPYANTTKTTNGITFTDNGDGSITINGTNNGSGNSNFFFTSTTEFKLSAGTYTLGNFVSTNNNVNVVLYDGTLYHQVPSNSSKTLTYNNETTCYIYIGINRGTAETFNNVVVKPMLVSGTELGDYQPYNGAIVHEKDIADFATSITDVVYDYSDTSKQSINGTAYTNGLMFGNGYNIDLNKYKKIILTISAGSKSNRVLCEIPILSQGTNRGSFVGTVNAISYRTMVFGSEEYNTTDKTLYLFQCYTSTIGSADGTISYSTDTSYTVTKIEGVC